MKKTHRYLFAWMLLLATLVSCHVQPEEEQPAEPTPITGLVTRAGASVPPTSAYTIGVIAKLGTANYLNGVAATMAIGGNITFNGTTWYYPLNKSTLRFYAYTGSVTSDLMTLTAGAAAANDALLSNNGGVGTPGSATAQVRNLDFSHVMTKLEVAITTDGQEEPVGTWVPATLRLTMAGVVGTGKYNISSLPGASATATSGTYTINKGVNYLVPTGAQLSNKLTSLVIDNYTATAADLANFTITSAGAPYIVLTPGAAYKLTFNIKRLHLESITLSLGSWTNTNISNDNIDYTAQSRTLNLGTYTGSDITKVIVNGLDNNLYTGTVTANTVSFLLAPPTAQSVSLYTADGLLLTTSNDITLTGTDLSVGDMNEYGMLTINPALSYDPITNPYAVSTPVQFKKITAAHTYNYQQTAHMNLGGVQTPTIDLSGSYDGNGFQINGVNMLGTGLFKEVYAGQTVKNVRIASGCVTQSGIDLNVGGLCGKNSGTIVACVNEALIVSTVPRYVGGICGENAGTLIACMNAGDIKSVYGVGSAVGGICGHNSNAAPAILSALNVGLLRLTGTPLANQVAGICGLSASGATINTAYWLTGTAEQTIGTPEVAANGLSLTLTDAADLSQQWIRDPSTLTRLNATIPAPWPSSYNFIRTQLTWPMPVKL